MTHTQILQESTQHLYTIFAGYQSQTISETGLADIPLATLNISQLTPVIENLNNFNEADHVLRHFLPRIMELSIEGYHHWSMGLEDVFRTLKITDWHLWADEEIRSVKMFINDLWEHHLTTVSPTGTTSSVDTLLEACGQIIDIEPMLEKLSKVGHRSATAHIASLAVYGKKQHQAVRHWLAQPSILQRIEAAFWDCKDSDHAAMFAKAAEYLRQNDTTPMLA